MDPDLAPVANSQPRHAGFQFTLRRLFVWVLCVSLGLSMLVTLARMCQNAQRAALSCNAQCPLNQLQLALRIYHDIHGCFPPAYIADENGVPIHSWRVLILPYIEQQSLYDAYNFNEPWNGPNNWRLAAQMPGIFCSPTEDPSTSFTNIVAITGPGTAFPGGTSTSLADFADGAENTILLTEVRDSDIPWLQPRDLDTRQYSFKINDPAAIGISSVSWRRPYVVFADSIHAYAVSIDIPPEALRALSTIAAQEPVTRSQLVDKGYLE